MHNRCCWPPESDNAELPEAELDQVPEGGLAQGDFGRLVQKGTLPYAGETKPGYDVVKDAHSRERVGPLKDHPDPAAHELGRRGRPIDVQVAQPDAALDPTSGVVVKPVDRPQERRFATP